MLSQVHQQKYPGSNQFIQSSFVLIQATLITSIIGAIASTQPNRFLSSSAFAQGIQSSDQTVLVEHQSNASQLGGVVQTNCLQEEEMGVAPEHRRSKGPFGCQRLNPDSLKEAEAEINALLQAGFQVQPQQKLPEEIIRILF